MPLTCYCDDYPEPGDTIWYEAMDYEPFNGTRRKRCSSCGTLISRGELCARSTRYRIPSTDVERKIYGDDGEIRLADAFLCERCADLYFSLIDLKYCVLPFEDMRELVAEYAALHQFETETGKPK